MTENPLLLKTTCFHCGDDCLSGAHTMDEKTFCCTGCQSVYRILNDNQLCSYYQYNEHPGSTRDKTAKRFDYLADPEIIGQLTDYTDSAKTIVTFYIPHIHCSSCLWLLEQLNRINPAVHYCRVDFLKKQLNIRFDHQQLSLQTLVELLFDIGYEPLISLQDVIRAQNATAKDDLVQKIAVAGFCFGNVMLLSFPEYFGLSAFEQSFRHFFGWLNVLFALPVVFYSGWGYFRSAWQHLRNQVLHIDLPLALGITVLFIRTVAEVFTHTGAGFADTLCGLVFFLLVGKFVQQRTYHHISFERDYRSFFPVAVQVMLEGRERPVPLSQLRTGQRMVIRNNEIIPADAILLKGEARVDFSFVTGEAAPVRKTLGEIVYAGGRQTGQAIELEVVKPVSQSYLTQLWNNEAFTRKRDNRMQTFNERVSKYFTMALLAVAMGAFLFWAGSDLSRGLAACTAVLIVACPCALALSTPFTMSAALGVFDKNFFYLKNTGVVEQLAHIDTIVMDKTGTLTLNESNQVKLQGRLTDEQADLVYSACLNSNHPLSRMICQFLGHRKSMPVLAYEEIAGKGIVANVNGCLLRIGSSEHVFGEMKGLPDATRVYIQLDDRSPGCFCFSHRYREGMGFIPSLPPRYDTYLLSGDRDHDLQELQPFFKSGHLHFDHSPQQKLDFVQALQRSGHKVMMIGDGLNDAGALKQSDLGIAVTDQVNNFTPGSDAILDGRSFARLPQFLRFARDTVTIIHVSFLISLAYNLLGLGYAVSGRLQPLTAAILMPLSTATIITFTSLATRYAARKRRLA